jgi:hypothetical protein
MFREDITLDNNNNINSSVPTEQIPKPKEETLSSLTDKFNTLENNNTEIRKNMDALYFTVCEMNKNMEKIMNKLDSAAVNKESMGMEESKTSQSIKNMMMHPLKKLMVSVLSGVYAVTDKTTEMVSGVMENVEDIVAEAQYNNKKSRMSRTQEQV